MGETNTSGVSGRAAVLVVDNQLGLAGVPAGTMNDIGQTLLMDIIEGHYDQVYIVVAHNRQAKDNEVVKALKQAASKYGVVDMYVNMHTNMDNGTLAQVPLSAFDQALTQSERTHLRLLYNMGCYDGNEVSAIVARQLGFKTFLGHTGNSASPLFAYQAIAEWVEGDHSILTDWFFDLFGDERLSTASRGAYKDMGQCLPDVRDELIGHWDIVQRSAQAAVDCTSEMEQTGKPQTAEAVFACVEKKVPEVRDTAADVLKTAAGCMPELAELALRQRGKIQRALHQNDRWELPDEVRMAAGAKRDEAKEYLDGEVRKYTEGTTPFLAGKDIEFDEMPDDSIPPRREQVERLAGIVRHEIGEEGSALRISTSAAFSLAQMGATGELETIAHDKSLLVENRFIAILALMEKDAKYYSVFEEVLKEPTDEKTAEKFNLVARNIVIWNLNNDDAAWVISRNSKVEFLRVEALIRLIIHDRLTAEELKDLFHWQGRFANIATNESAIWLIKRIALGHLMEKHHEDAIPVMREIFSGQVVVDNNYFSDAYFEITLHHRYSFDDFTDVFYQMVTGVDRFNVDNGSTSERFGAYQQRNTCLFRLEWDESGRKLLVSISRRIIKESDNRLLRIAACLYLYDHKEMNDEEFLSATGWKRKDVEEEGDEDVFGAPVVDGWLKKYLIPPDTGK